MHRPALKPGEELAPPSLQTAQKLSLKRHTDYKDKVKSKLAKIVGPPSQMSLHSSKQPQSILLSPTQKSLRLQENRESKLSIAKASVKIVDEGTGDEIVKGNIGEVREVIGM